MSTLHVHLDESGNFRFSPEGSRYYIFAAAWTYEPAPLAHELTNLSFSLVKKGLNIQAFHASPDRQDTRDAVVSILTKHNTWQYAAIVVEKSKVNPNPPRSARFLP